MQSRQHGFIIADMGGGTLDFSAYRITGTMPLQVEEIAANKCKDSTNNPGQMLTMSYL
jgi:molecular chaperone DnaK (HSP70)